MHCIAICTEKRLIDHLYSKKYNLYILDNTTLSEEVKQEEKIKKIDMPATIDYTKRNFCCKIEFLFKGKVLFFFKT
jgi:hypothetical protein